MVDGFAFFASELSESGRLDLRGFAPAIEADAASTEHRRHAGKVVLMDDRRGRKSKVRLTPSAGFQLDLVVVANVCLDCSNSR